MFCLPKTALASDFKVRWRRQDSPVPLAMFAHRQYTRKRNCAARGDEKPLRVGLSSPGSRIVAMSFCEPRSW